MRIWIGKLVNDYHVDENKVELTLKVYIEKDEEVEGILDLYDRYEIIVSKFHDLLKERLTKILQEANWKSLVENSSLILHATQEEPNVRPYINFEL